MAAKNTKSAPFQHNLSVLKFGQDISDDLNEQSYVNVRQLVIITEDNTVGLKNKKIQIFIRPWKDCQACQKIIYKLF